MMGNNPIEKREAFRRIGVVIRKEFIQYYWFSKAIISETICYRIDINITCSSIKLIF